MTKSQSNRCRRWVARGALAVALSAPALASAQGSEPVDAPSDVLEAERLGEQAFEAYSQKQYRAAVALYSQAYATSPSADALYNIARVYDLGLRDRTRAVAAYQRFLAEPGAPAERVERANERCNELLRAERAELDARGALRRPPPEQTAPTPPPSRDMQPSSGLSALRVGALVVGGVGVASAAVGGAFGVSVMSNADAANAACNGNRCTTQRAVDAARTASCHATLATVGVSLGAALVATGTVLWIVGGDASVEQGEPAAHAASARLHMTPIASSSELGLALVGGF